MVDIRFLWKQCYWFVLYFPHAEYMYTWNILTWIYPAFANSVDPDQLATEEANWSGSALFAIKYVNL